jgi:hypothetical protein
VYCGGSETTCYEIKWKPPVNDVLKININGSMDPDSASGGRGLVFRDELGVVASSGAGHMEHVQDVLHTEAEAYLQSLFEAQNLVYFSCSRRN